ncbi:hypothetical protein PCH_Pc22g18150 [Penicillium rubens Wisconsin 54-1255]|uniref:Uncharacterized protein n=1 Tax=Penicillium rubens (strain ATCC 28089 / DSM 1075 / NRRL 1951 / Wisconsin 54-1255) TaxID=500485 RepID=B6HU51_PENRW|nr:hypothetical protein PCH_Pc22g18150 [Penicillium rubens Wisconsin 54-1255]
MEYGNDSDYILPNRIGKRSSVSRRSREGAQKLPLDPGKVSLITVYRGINKGNTLIKEGASKIFRRSLYKRLSESLGTTRSFTTTARGSIKPIDTKPRRNTKVTKSGKVDISKFPSPLSSLKALGGIGGDSDSNSDSDSDSNSSAAGSNSGIASGNSSVGGNNSSVGVGTVIAGPAGIGKGARGIVTTPVITNYSGDRSLNRRYYKAPLNKAYASYKKGKKKASKEKGRAISPSKAPINPITIPPAKDKGKGKAIPASASLAKAGSAITTPSKSIKKRTASNAPSGKDKGS